MANKEKLLIENARLIFRNFNGNKGRFNEEGRRSFCVVIEDEGVAHNLANDGWNVKKLEPRDNYDEPTYYISVKVRFDNYPPKVVMIVNKRKHNITESTVGLLDSADILSADVLISPSYREEGGVTKISAYLNKLYVTIQIDEFEKKYEDMEWASNSSGSSDVMDDEDIPF